MSKNIYDGAKQVMVEALLKQALNADTVATVIKDLVTAETIKVFNNNGEIIYSRPLINYEARAKGGDMLATMLNLKPKEVVKHEGLENLEEVLARSEKRAIKSRGA